MRLFQMIGSMLSGNKGRKFYLQLIITMICIGIIPPLLMNIAAYRNMSANFYREASENNRNYLNQTITSVEIIVNQILSSSQQLMLNGAVREFESFPRGAYFEKLQGSFDSGEMNAHYNYLKSKQNAFDHIRKFKLSNTFMVSVYLYESRSQMVYAIDSDNREISLPFDQFYDQQWFASLQQNAVSPLFTDSRRAKTGQEDSSDVLTILLRTGVLNNAVVINLEASKVYQQILDKFSSSNELYVTNQAGKIILHRDNELLNRDLRAIVEPFSPETNESGYFLTSGVDGPIMVSFAKSQVLDWWFVNTISMDKLLQTQRYFQQTILIYSSLLVFLVILLSALSSKRLYLRFSSALQERDYFKEKMEESLPFYRERFKLSLLQEHSYSEMAIREKVHYLQAGVPMENPMVWLISRETDSRRRNYSGDMDNIRLLESIKECPIMKRLEWAAVEVSAYNMALILSAEQEEMSSLFQAAKDLLEHVKAKLGFDLSIGVSRPIGSVTDLARAFAEAEEALKYRIVLGSEQVIYYGDVAANQKRPYHYPVQKASMIFSSVKLGHAEKAAELFKEWMNEIGRQRNSVHYDQIVPVYMRLLNDVISSVSETGYDTRWIEEENPYQTILGLKSSLQVAEWFESFIRLTAERILEEHKQVGNQHIEKARQIIQRDFAKEVTLQSVSDELKLSPNYVSRLFKQTTGQSFVDYVTAQRIEKAKTLLLEQTLKINEICLMVGYSSSYYFIKVFRDQTGMTPGEFRKMSRYE